ncbi:MAG: biotin--[acetyl-CoA-carboxylase] ligase [Candidatus Bipolaricaulota bacterium]|nr:biotin--[acetyl-CoA-carboxylase] ligase [Candidatus Bipolaricaulota bacterium]
MKTRIIRYEQVSSTQEIARELALSGTGEGSVIVAEVQEHGRGRHGRAWLSPRGGLYASIIMRPDPLLPLRVGVAIARALKEISISAVLKWPNDVLVRERKIAGILIEAVEQWAIVGIGVNIEQAPLATATCVRGETSEPVARDILVKLILKNIEGVLSGEILGDYEALSGTIGQAVRIEVEGADGVRVIRGQAIGIDRTGRLLVEAEGVCHTIVSGECIHLRSPAV